MIVDARIVLRRRLPTGREIRAHANVLVHRSFVIFVYYASVCLLGLYCAGVYALVCAVLETNHPDTRIHPSRARIRSPPSCLCAKSAKNNSRRIAPLRPGRISPRRSSCVSREREDPLVLFDACVRACVCVCGGPQPREPSERYNLAPSCRERKTLEFPADKNMAR